MRHELTRIFLVTGALSLTLLTTRAHAQQVAPLVPQMEAPMASELIIRFHDAMAKGLKTGGLKVVPAKTVRDKMGVKVELAGCFRALCLSAARQKLGIKRLAVAKVSTIGKNYTIAVRIYKGSKVLGSGTGRCDICTLNEAIKTMNRVAEELGTRTEEPPEPGPTPAPKPVVKPPPKPAPKPVVKPAPKPAPKPIVKQPDPVEDEPKKPWPLWPALVTAGLGVAGLGVGVPFIVMDGTGAECVGEARADLRNCTRLYDTGTMGWIFAGVGIGSLAASGVLMYLYFSNRPKEKSTAAVQSIMVSPTRSGGIVFGATGRF